MRTSEDMCDEARDGEAEDRVDEDPEGETVEAVDATRVLKQSRVSGVTSYRFIPGTEKVIMLTFPVLRPSR